MKRFLVLAASLLLISASSSAQDKQPTPEERAYKFRTSLFQTFSWKLGQLYGAQAGGDEAAFNKHASDLVMLAKMVDEGFQIADSIPEGSAAKAEIWEDYDSFQEKGQALVAASQALTEEGAMVDFNVRDFGSKNCGGCHRDFRVKDE